MTAFRGVLYINDAVGPRCRDLGILYNVHRLFRMAAMELLASRLLNSHVRTVTRLTPLGLITNERFGVEPETLLRSLVETADHLGIFRFPPNLYCFGPENPETELLVRLASFERSEEDSADLWNDARGFYDGFVSNGKIRRWESLRREESETD